MRRTLASLAISFLVACGGGGGTDVDAPPMIDGPPTTAPAFRNPVNLPDDELALAALRLLGANVTGAEQRCQECHGLTRQKIRYWRAISDTSMATCLTDLAVTSADSAHMMINCFRAKPGDPNSQFQTPRLGVWSTASHLPWFQYTFQKAYGGTTELQDFITRVGMPKPGAQGTALTQEQFDIVAEWFVRGVPMLDDLLPEDPPPDTCENGVSADVAAHVATMKTEGWRARNAEDSLNMWACAGATDPLQCLSSVPLASTKTYGAGWDVSSLGRNRVLKEFVVGYASSFWTRSSADGRYLGHGSWGSGSTIVDFTDGHLINVSAAYDPAFFPDNMGFVFQGGNRNVCAQSVLNGATSVTMNEPGCSYIDSVGLYEHVGRFYGGDYFSISGQFVSDDGGHQVDHSDPYASFTSNSDQIITPMVFDGTRFTPKSATVVETPHEGDAVLSPSARLAVTRVSGPGDRQLGFVLRKVVAVPNGSSYTITLPEIARYCKSGGKPAFSYDERWMVYHHYIGDTDADAQDLGYTGRNDPGFDGFQARGGANVYLVELATGQIRRVTRMNPGQYALFPHFRSDGWIYYQVRDLGNTGSGDEREYSVALDAALLLE